MSLMSWDDFCRMFENQIRIRSLDVVRRTPWPDSALEEVGVKYQVRSRIEPHGTAVIFIPRYAMHAEMGARWVERLVNAVRISEQTLQPTVVGVPL